MKKIVWLIPSFNPSNGGPLRVPTVIVPQLQIQGFNIEIIPFFTKYIPKREPSNPTQKINTITILADLLNAFYHHLQHYRSIFISDAVIISGVWSPLLILLYVKSILCNSTLIVRTCGMLSPYYYRRINLKHKIALALYTLPILRSSLVCKVCNSRRELSLLKPFNIHNYTYIENPGFQTLRPSSLTNQQFSIRYNASKVVFFSRLHPVKGLHVAIQAANIAMQHLPNLQLYIVGPSSSPSYLKECNELIKSSFKPDNFKIIPPIYHESEKVRFLSSCSCLLHPTFAEGFPNSVIECLSLSLPVLTTPESNISHSLRQSFGLSINHDPHLIAQSIVYTLTNYEFYLKCSVEAGRIAEEIFSPHTVASKYAKILK